MNILLILPPQQPNTGGNVTYSNRLKKGLAPYGIEIQIGSLDRVTPTDYERADIIHVFNAYRTGRFVLPAVKRLRKPMILTITGTDINEHMAQEPADGETYKVVEYASRVIQLTGSCRQELIDLVPGTADKSIVVNLGVDLPPLICKHRAEFGFQPDDFIFLLPAGIRPVKNPFIAYEPLKRVQQQYPNVRFVIAGPIMDNALCKKLHELLEVTDWMSYLGEVEHQDMPALMQCADVVLNSSKSEGLSHALLEAMWLGKPIMASKVVGNIDLIFDGINGFLFSDANEFAEKAIRYLEDPALRQRLAENGQKWVRDHYTVENEIRTFKRIYEEVMCQTYCMQSE